MKKKIFIAMLTILVAAFAVSCACDTTTTPTPSPSLATTPLTSVRPSETPMASPSPSTSPDTSPAESPKGDGTSAIDTAAMRTEVEKLSEVKKATVAAMGDTALVGIQFDDAYQGTLTARITEMVTEKVKAADTAIEKVHVTADQTLFDEISKMSGEEGTGAATAPTQEDFDALAKKIEPVA